MRIAFVDEDGFYSKNQQYETFDWVVMNTRETIHKQESVFSINPLILLRFFFLKIKELKENFSWIRVKFHWKTKTFFSVGCVLKSRDRDMPKKLYHGMITFEEFMKNPIKNFVGDLHKDFQIAFVFNNGWIRQITFKNGELFSSRLTSLRANSSVETDFIVCDDEVKTCFENSISSSEFGAKIGQTIKTLQDFILDTQFFHLKDIIVPLPVSDFKCSIFSFHGKTQIFRQFMIMLVMGTLCLWYEISRFHLTSDNNHLSESTTRLELNIKQDTDLKRKKEFAGLFVKKGMENVHSPLQRVKELSFLPTQGFYVQVMNWETQTVEKMNLVLKPFNTKNPKEILRNFAVLEQTCKKNLIDVEVIVHKPPFGIEKTKGEMRKTLKKKPSSRGKIEIIWNKKK